MSVDLGAFCDEFYVSTRLFLKLEIAPERETILHFFERLRKQYPGLRKMRRREAGSLVLEEEAEENGSRRWFRLDTDSLRFGHYMPPDIAAVRGLADFVLTQAPHHLTLSELDFDHMELVYGFDLNYRGNHDQLVAETLFPDVVDNSFLAGDHAHHVIDAQPCFGIALSPQCDLQAYLEIKSRTSTYEIRNAMYETQPISVFLTLRKYWGVDPPATLSEGATLLFDKADALAVEKVVPNFVNPLAAAIASRS